MRTMVVVAIGATIAAGALATACAQGESPTDSTDESSSARSAPTSTSGPPGTDVLLPDHADRAVVELPDAVSANVAHGPDGPIVVWTERDGVFGAGLDTATGELTNPWQVPGDIVPFAHVIERPAVAVDDDGRIHVAYTTLADDGGSVAYTVRDGETSTVPEVISGPPRAETVLVHMTDRPVETPVLAWLEDSTLSVAVAETGLSWKEHEGVDDSTCDCCNPVPLLVGDDLVVAYRDLERTADGVIRDVAMTRSTDGGSTFTDRVVIADDHWFLDACPFSGPDVVEVDGDLVVAWMDGRQTIHPDQEGTTIWVDRSVDGGGSFGRDVALTSEGIHRWPVMAVDANATVHLVWETQAVEDGGITYTSSVDGGTSFGTPRLLVADTPDSGLLRAPSVAVAGDDLVVSWMTSTSGARVALYSTAEPAP